MEFTTQSWKEDYALGKVILMDKPLRWTSFDVVKKIRILTGIRKVGHAGTLDPLATGLLIVCTGKFTKKINEYMAREKEYTGTITIGGVTPTFDLESSPEHLKNYHHVTEQMISAATRKFTGIIQQIPPAHSAIKKDGTPAYKLARRGEEVKMNPREVTIYSFEITGVELPVIHFKVVCSTGTYIRSLANDLGAELDCGGYLSSLCRTRIGEFLLQDAKSVEEFEQEIRALKDIS
jgi:tRNA pseudouridine55 synthase